VIEPRSVGNFSRQGCQS